MTREEFDAATPPEFQRPPITDDHDWNALAELISERMETLSVALDAELSLEYLSGSVQWSDEMLPPPFPSWDCLSFMKRITRFRSTSMLGTPDERCRLAWDAARSHFPRWIGFLPERCNNHRETMDLLRHMERQLEVCERAMRMSDLREKQGDGKGE